VKTSHAPVFFPAVFYQDARIILYPRLSRFFLLIATCGRDSPSRRARRTFFSLVPLRRSSFCSGGFRPPLLPSPLSGVFVSFSFSAHTRKTRRASSYRNRNECLFPVFVMPWLFGDGLPLFLAIFAPLLFPFLFGSRTFSRHSRSSQLLSSFVLPCGCLISLFWLGQFVPIPPSFVLSRSSGPPRQSLLFLSDSPRFLPLFLPTSKRTIAVTLPPRLLGAYPTVRVNFLWFFFSNSCSKVFCEFFFFFHLLSMFRSRCFCRKFLFRFSF